MEVGRVKEEAMEKITDRLSLKEGLYFPRSVQPNTAVPSQRKSLLLDLLSRDAAVFLERYGAELTTEELGEFDAMEEDYEVSWHLRDLRSKMSPSKEEVRKRSVRVKNRRQAYLERLVRGGSYFSEEAMRDREPYLHHELVGKFQDQTARGMARPGERWSETLLRRCEEAELLEKIRVEQRRMGVAEQDLVGFQRGAEEEQEEEEEEEEDDDDDEEDEEGERKAHGGAQISEVNGGTQPSQPEHARGEACSDEDMSDRMDQFTYVMHQKFLAGEDHQHLDYSKIDDDETLDDHWHREANLDAEDRYFAQVED